METNFTGRHVTNPAAPKPLASGSWPYSNGDFTDTRGAAGSTITSANVYRLKQASTFHITVTAAASVSPFDALSANPIVVNGVVYIQDLEANVYALALAPGKLQWEYEPSTPMKTGPGPDGVAGRSVR
jgi:glucose dehydrogenase